MGVCVSSFQQKLWDMPRNKKAKPIHRGEKKPSIENIPEETQTLDLLDINIKLNYLNTFIDEVSNH